MCVDSRDINNRTPLHYAVQNGFPSIVQFLVEAGADVNAETLLYTDTPYLCLALENMHQEIVVCLIKCGANISHKGLKRTLLHTACRMGWLNAVQSLVDRKVNVNIRDWCGGTPLFTAIEYSQWVIFDFFVKAGANLKRSDFEKMTLLHQACQTGFIEVIQSLVDSGLDINAKTRDGETPLFIAAKFSHIDIFDFLLEAGADVDVKIPQKWYHLEDVEEWKVFQHASFKGWSDVVMSLIKHEIDINVKTVKGDTPLHLSLRNNNLEIVKHLLEAGADCNVSNDHGTAFECFIKNCRSVEVVKLFLESGAYIQTYYYEVLSKHVFFKEDILQDAKLCTQAILNEFNNLDLYEVYLVPMAVEYLPPMERMKMAHNRNAARCIEQSVKHEIDTHGYCNLTKVRPLVLSLMAARSFIDHFL